MLKKLFHRWLKNYCIKNYPLKITTKKTKIYLIYVKKGKIREWRAYNGDWKRLTIEK